MSETRAVAKGTDRGCISIAEVQGRPRPGEGAAIVDVRSTEEFAASHIDGAVNIPLEALVRGWQEQPMQEKGS